MSPLARILQDCLTILPELALIVAVCAIVLADVALPRERGRRAVRAISFVGLALALGFTGLNYGNYDVFRMPDAEFAVAPKTAFSGMIVADRMTDFFRVVVYLGTFASLLIAMRSSELLNYRAGEFHSLILVAAVSASLLAASTNFLMVVLAIETLSLSSYALVGYAKKDRLSSEAALKYLLYGSVASAVMLFGISYLYGLAGTLDVRNAFFAISMRESSTVVVGLALVLVLAGLGFKVSAAPFHFWTPDVYQGAPTPVTAFLSVVSKAAGFAAILRLTLPFFALGGPVVPDRIAAIQGSLESVLDGARIPTIFWIMSVVSMFVGNLVALRQTDVKRILAYSSVAQAGYLLMAATAFNNAALEAILFYFFVYLFSNLGAFLVVVLIRERIGSTDVTAWKGIAWQSPWLFMLMFVFMISLTGLPPTAGFLGKLALFRAVMGAGTSELADGVMTSGAWFYYSLAIIGAINSAISLFYYLKVVKAMAFEQPAPGAPVFRLGFFDNLHLSLVYGVPVALMIFNLLPFVGFGAAIDMTTLFR